MSARRAAVLKAELAVEREAFERAAREALDLVRRAAGAPAADQVYALALMLHGFYNGVERVFTRVSLELDGGPPSGPDSHIRLLDAMALEITGSRPAVVAVQTRDRLRPLLALRHAVRHLYFFDLDWARLLVHAEALPTVVDALRSDLDRFDGFLSTLGETGAAE